MSFELYTEDYEISILLLQVRIYKQFEMLGRVNEAVLKSVLI